MARPHICFLQSQTLSWEASDGGVECKALSLDDENGSLTMLLRMPAGFRDVWELRPGEYRELLVLAGELLIGADAYSKHGYAYLCQQDRKVHVATEQGATLLLMSGPASADRTEVSIPTSVSLPWKFAAEGSVTGKPLGAGIATKLLRRDPSTGEQSFLYAAMPHHPPPTVMVGKFTHPVIEEIFTLAGSYVFGDAGRMGPGGYVFWREQQWHGPAGSETGYLLFIRVLGGPLSNVFSEEPAPFSYDPPYRPALPDYLQSIAKPYGEPEEY